MKNSEILQAILKKAEENHIKLYHDVTKREIEDYISTLTNLDELDSVHFDYEMLKIFNKFKDAHTTYFYPTQKIDKQLFYVENKLAIKIDNEFYEIKAIGNMPVKQFILKLSEIQAYETEEFLKDCIRADINNFYVYKMLDLVSSEKIEFIIDNNGKEEVVCANCISLEEYEQLGFSSNSKFYSYNVLDNKILHIKYRKCWEHKDYPFSKFIEELKNEIEKSNINKYVLDLRDNHGGNSEIIRPLIKLVKEKNLQGVLIINNGVFSSGRWAVADFKKNFNTPIFGEPTGGAAASYGYNQNFTIAGKEFSVSIRYWDFSDVFGTKGTIKPDYHVPTTFEDLKNRTDAQLDACIKYLTSEHLVDI